MAGQSKAGGTAPGITKTDLARLQSYLRKTFGTPNLEVRARPRKTDSAEVYIGEEFIATVTLDTEDGGRDWQLQMAILEMDLET
jgi:hypothetical protein